MVGTVENGDYLLAGEFGAASVTTPVVQVTRQRDPGPAADPPGRGDPGRRPAGLRRPGLRRHVPPLAERRSSDSATAPSASGSGPRSGSTSRPSTSDSPPSWPTSSERRTRPLWPHPTSGDDVADLRATIRAFLGAALLRPELGRLMNQEGLYRTARLDYIIEQVMVPFIAGTGGSLERLQAAGRIRPVTARALFFLVAHGAEAPYTLTALSGAFDAVDGPLDPDRHADDVTDLIMRGIVARLTVARCAVGSPRTVRLECGDRRVEGASRHEQDRHDHRSRIRVRQGRRAGPGRTGPHGHRHHRDRGAGRRPLGGGPAS